jgi:hypothetical protein
MSLCEKSIGVWYDGDKTLSKLANAFNVLAVDYNIATADNGGVQLVCTEDKSITGFKCKLDGNVAEIAFSEIHYCTRAVSLIMAGLIKDGEEVEEKSPFDNYGIMLDCSRNKVFKVEQIKKWLRRLSMMGYNTVMLYTEDTYEIEGEPLFGYLRGAYTAEELKQIDDYANSLGIEMIPCIQVLGHLEQILQWPGYGKIKDTARVMLVDEPETYKLIEKMIETFKNAFRTDRIHIGMDETHDLGRGRFMDKNGYERGFDIFNRHLSKVVDICKKYEYKPMIWSDMYFRLGNATQNYYDLETVIPDDVKAKIPEEVQLVYWDYYHAEKDFYDKFIDMHRDLAGEPFVASGVWTWSQTWYNHDQTVNCAGPCVKSCIEKNTRELIFTMWGDDGAYCDFDSALAGLMWLSEYAYCPEKMSDERLEKIYETICGSSFAATVTASGITTLFWGEDGKRLEHDAFSVPSVLWDDPIFNIYINNYIHFAQQSADKHSERLVKIAEQLNPVAEINNAGDFSHAIKVAKFLSKKLAIASELHKAYNNADKKTLANIKEREVCEAIALLEEMMESFRKQWLEQCKPFGLEVLQKRFAGLKIRYEELAKRLGEFLNGEIEEIPELEAHREVPSEHPSGGNRYLHLASGSSIV